MSRRTLAEVEETIRKLRQCPGHKASEGFVYVLRQRDGRGFVKIGKTKNLKTRVGDHQGNAFGELQLVAAFHGYTDLERELHVRFSRSRVWSHREHFRQSREVRRFVDDLQRLNCRDGLCWSCRAEELAARQEFPAVDVRDPDAIDTSCGERCHSVSFWYQKGNCKPCLDIIDSTNKVANEVAGAYFRAPSTFAWLASAWAVQQCGGRGWHPCYQYAEGYVRRFVNFSLDLDHRACRVLPHELSFPIEESLWDVDRFTIPQQRRSFVHGLLWASRDLFESYGVARICVCGLGIQYPQVYAARFTEMMSAQRVRAA